MAHKAVSRMKEKRMDPKSIKRVVVVGAGVMGNGIAQVFARAGIQVGLVDVDDKALQRARSRIKSDLDNLKMLDLLSGIKAFDPV